MVFWQMSQGWILRPGNRMTVKSGVHHSYAVAATQGTADTDTSTSPQFFWTVLVFMELS